MYQKPIYRQTTLKINNSYIAERLEDKVARITQNKEPIANEVPMIFTTRDEGVKPEHNIRTDKWEIAAEEMTKVVEMKLAKRNKKEATTDTNTNDGGTPDANTTKTPNTEK